MPTALIVLADGFEEIEAVTPIDLLRRAGIDVTVATLNLFAVTGKTGLTLQAQVHFDAVEDDWFDLLILPGGPGHALLRGHEGLREVIRRHYRYNKLIGAICAAPLVLAEAGLLDKHRFTGHFSIAAELPRLDPSQAVIADGQIITSQGAGTAIEFSLELISALCGREKADSVAASICSRPS